MSEECARFLLVRFEVDQEECERQARELQTLVTERGDKLVQSINNYKNTYIDFIEKHRRTLKQV